MTWTLERTTRAVMVAYAVTFGIAGLVFLLAPEWTADQGRRIGSLDTANLWLATTLGLMALLTYCSVLVYRDPARYAAVLPGLATSKTASSIAGGLLALVHGQPGLWLVAVTDLPLAVIAMALWLRGRG